MKIYVALGSVAIGIAAVFAYVAVILTDAAVMTTEEYRLQAQQIVRAQITAPCASAME